MVHPRSKARLTNSKQDMTTRIALDPIVVILEWGVHRQVQEDADMHLYDAMCNCRAKPPVGRNEMKSLLKGPDAPDPAQLAAMGSRNALSPRRATALMRETLGHTEVLTPH